MLALKEETSEELYSEIIRSGFSARDKISYREREYLDRLAAQKGLTAKDAGHLEQNIREDLGLDPLDFREEYVQAVVQAQGGSDWELIRRIYGQEGRLNAEDMERLTKSAGNGHESKRCIIS